MRPPHCIAIVLLLLHANVGSFVLIASDGATAPHFAHVGRTWTYRMRTRTTFAEVPAVTSTTAVYEVTALVDVRNVWQSVAPSSGGDDAKLLAVRVYDVAVAPSSDDNETILYAIWRRGRIEGVLRQDGDGGHLNLAKGVVGLLQYQLGDNVDAGEETDASGVCAKVSYDRTHAHTLRKTKGECHSSDLYAHANPTPFLRTHVQSVTSTTEYDLPPTTTNGDHHPIGIRLEERHVIALPADERVTRTVTVDLQMAFERAMDTPRTDDDVCIDCTSLADAQRHLQMARTLHADTLLTQFAHAPPAAITFGECVRTHHVALTHYGGADAALAFLSCVQVARTSAKKDLLSVFKSHKQILPQLLDILGHAQTPDAHAAVMKHVHVDNSAHAAWAERYLWASSFSARPHPAIIGDLLHKFTHTPNIPATVSGTLISTLATMVRNLHAAGTPHDRSLHTRITDAIIGHMDASVGEGRVPFLRALANLRSPATLPRLLQLVSGRDTPARESVQAWRAIHLLFANLTHAQSTQVRARALRTVLQLDKREDSSARTQAVDVLLAAAADDDVIMHLVRFLGRGAPYAAADAELRQYVLERMRMFQLANATARCAHAHNYDALAPRALSVAMRRQCYRSTDGATRAFLSTVQEISNGFVKRGVVSMSMSDGSVEQEMFGLGIFSGGLDAFVASSSTDDTTPTEATAGMELTVLGAQLRPFVFFRGQGELMGHVWSGTASDRTTAFQALAMLQDHVQTLRLGNGMHVHVQSVGAASFDLAGNIVVSLWHRHADAGVEQAVGVATRMTLTLHTSHAAATQQMALESTQTLAPQLRLAAAIDFAAAVNICMRLEQAAVVYEQTVRRKAAAARSGRNVIVRRRRHSDGITYALNRKNDAMCNAMHAGAISTQR